MTVELKLKNNNYKVVIERGVLPKAADLLKLDRTALVVTDSGVPEKYARAVARGCRKSGIFTLNQGEQSKNFSCLEALCRRMLEMNMDRGDCVIAVGGGVVGDIAGFAASCYMRGIDFYNIPTTLLAQVDSSVGGKTAIDLCGIKNCVGSFYQPQMVLIDPDTLSTLPDRHISNGLAEAVKMAATSDEKLFSVLEYEDINSNIDYIIERCVKIKAAVVSADEREQGLRRVLNFGHTIGHGIESCGMSAGMLHGECVALGMLPMCAEPVRKRLSAVLRRLSLPTENHYSAEQLWQSVIHDKKHCGDRFNTVYVPQIGQYEFRTLSCEEMKKLLEEAL